MQTADIVEKPKTATFKQGCKGFGRIAVNHASALFALGMDHLRMGDIFTADFLKGAMPVSLQMRCLGNMGVHQRAHGLYLLIVDGKGPNRALAHNGDQDSLLARAFASFVAGTRLRPATDVGFIHFYDAAQQSGICMSRVHHFANDVAHTPGCWLGDTDQPGQHH